ncbi:peptidase inhibitor family I36 protein [Streptomyces albus]|uniref:peptidase inhibitor family I36 protein n=1 Tax=Streptomyces albus TaxID=1888 RepID=UPI003454CA26
MKGMLGRGPKTAAGLLAMVALALAAQAAGAQAESHTSPGTARGPAAAAGAAPRLGACGTGELCLWEKPQFKGQARTYELRSIDIESCTPLTGGAAAVSAANRTGRPVTLYQSAECAETAEFATHPSGSWSPELPYKARAFKVWES